MGKTDNFGTGKRSTSRIANTKNIAFVFESSYFNQIIDQFQSVNGSKLIAFIIEFKISVDGTVNEHDKLKLYKLIYDEQDPEIFFKDYIDDIPKGNGNGNGVGIAHNIHEESHILNPGNNKAATLLNPTISPIQSSSKIYEGLDGYTKDPDIRSVFFTVDEISSLSNFYDELILSGCEVKLKRKLSNEANSQNKTYKSSYFTLKIEGSGLNSKYKGMISEDDLSPGFIIGPHCPPVWRSFIILYSLIRPIGGGGDIGAVMDLFDKYKYKTMAYKPGDFQS